MIGEERGIMIGEERGIMIGEERGIMIGEKRERQSNIGIFIDGCRDFGATADAIVMQLVKRFKLSLEEATVLVNKRLS